MQRYTRLRMELEELRNDLDAMSAEVWKCSVLFTNTASHLKPSCIFFYQRQHHFNFNYELLLSSFVITENSELQRQSFKLSCKSSLEWMRLTGNKINWVRSIWYLTNCSWILLSLQKQKPSDSTIWSTLQAEAKKLLQQSETIEGHKGFEVLEYQLLLLFMKSVIFLWEFCSTACLSFYAVQWQCDAEVLFEWWESIFNISLLNISCLSCQAFNRKASSLPSRLDRVMSAETSTSTIKSSVNSTPITESSTTPHSVNDVSQLERRVFALETFLGSSSNSVDMEAAQRSQGSLLGFQEDSGMLSSGGSFPLIDNITRWGVRNVFKKFIS